MAYLDYINSPQDVKKLNVSELEALAAEIRQAILNRDSKIGGHVGPNLGIVEATIALHYVFDSPKDKLVFDVSHQSYPHKMLTGRKNGFTNDAEMSKVSGYTSPAESEHDFLWSGIHRLRSVWPAVWQKPAICRVKRAMLSRLSAMVPFPAARRWKGSAMPAYLAAI